MYNQVIVLLPVSEKQLKFNNEGNEYCDTQPVYIMYFILVMCFIQI